MSLWCGTVRRECITLELKWRGGFELLKGTFFSVMMYGANFIKISRNINNVYGGWLKVIFFFALRQSFVLDEKTKKKSNRTSYVEPTRKKEKISSLKIITIQSAREVSVPRARDRNDKLWKIAIDLTALYHPILRDVESV